MLLNKIIIICTSIILLGGIILLSERFEKSNTIIHSELIKYPIIQEVIATSYHPVEGQCDSTPLITADNSYIDLTLLKQGRIKWVAVSRDLLKRWGGCFNYGDTIYVFSHESRLRGAWVIRDCMKEGYVNKIDFLFSPNSRIFDTTNILISNIPFYYERHEMYLYKR